MDLLGDKALTAHSSADVGDLADANRFHDPVNIDGFEPESLRRLLEKMMLIRCAEERIGDHVDSKEIQCPCHLVIGQEAPAVGLAEHIVSGDRVFGAHRSHAHFLALGGGLAQLMAEVQGKDTGCSKGMGGSMHLIDIQHHLYGTVPIVAATIPIATGAALAAKMDGNSAIGVSFFGDGATEEGVFHESLNLAAVMKLPIVFVCENNFYSSHLHISLRQPRNSVSRFAEAHAVPWQRVDGNDVIAVYQAGRKAVELARKGEGPQFIEAVTYRWRGHVGPREDDDVGVDRKDNLTLWKRRDPIRRLADALIKAGLLSADELNQRWIDLHKQVDVAWRRAKDAPYPAATALLGRVYSSTAFPSSSAKRDG